MNIINQPRPQQNWLFRLFRFCLVKLNISDLTSEGESGALGESMSQSSLLPSISLSLSLFLSLSLYIYSIGVEKDMRVRAVYREGGRKRWREISIHLSA